MVAVISIAPHGPPPAQAPHAVDLESRDRRDRPETSAGCELLTYVWGSPLAPCRATGTGGGPCPAGGGGAASQAPDRGMEARAERRALGASIRATASRESRLRICTWLRTPTSREALQHSESQSARGSVEFSARVCEDRLRACAQKTWHKTDPAASESGCGSGIRRGQLRFTEVPKTPPGTRKNSPRTGEHGGLLQLTAGGSHIPAARVHQAAESKATQKKMDSAVTKQAHETRGEYCVSGVKRKPRSGAQTAEADSR